eukprot:gene6091-686_t
MRALEEWKALGWDTEASKRDVEAACKRKVVHEVDWNGALTVQNATLVASFLD